MSYPQLVERPISELRASPTNARTHSDKQIGQIADSIVAFTFLDPVIIDDQGNILCGHGRVRAAQKLGWTKVPTLQVDHLTDAQKRAYMIATNRLAELAGWDEDLLALELQHLLDCEVDFEITTTGFETAEIDLILGHSDEDGKIDAADAHLPELQELGVTKLGDLWNIGPHRVLCADALKPENYVELLGGSLARMVFTDPPYNVPISGHVSGLGAKTHREFVMASGELSDAEYTRFLSGSCRNMASGTIDGGVHFICMDWRHAGELLRAGRIAYDKLLNTCVWAKTSGAMGALYRSQHELVFVFKSGSAPHVSNVMLGRHGRNRTNVWTYPGLNSFQAGRKGTLAMHPRVKPVALVADAILDCSARRDIVLDPFLGSGTTILAAHPTGRRCYGMELDPLYVDVALRRLRHVLGVEPVCARSGESFTDRERTLGALPHSTAAMGH
jgi:DNA modification methylase